MVMVQISRAQVSEDVLYCMHFTNGFIRMKIHQLYIIYQTELGVTLWCENFLTLRNPLPHFLQQQHHDKEFAQSKLFCFNYYLSTAPKNPTPSPHYCYRSGQLNP